MRLSRERERKTETAVTNPIQQPEERRGAVAIIVRQDRLLVIRRSVWVRAPGAYCFPGGGIEPGESEPQALVRELAEELNVVVQPHRRVWRSVTPWRVHLAWWTANLDPAAAPVANPAEVEAIAWHTLEEIARLPGLLASNREFLDGIRTGRIGLDTEWA